MTSTPPPGFWGGVYTASDGETVNINLSDYYVQDPAFPQSIANFFALGLIHGSELAQLAVVVVEPLPAVQQNCGGNPYVLACYVSGYQILFMPGDQIPGVFVPSVVAHEYGHHIAYHSSNAPWDAFAWGAKRWASHANICSRVQGGTAFPGDEGANYTLNPGEAFAETYRILNEENWGWASFAWDVVDPSFFPDQAGVDAVRQDVTARWVANTLLTKVGRFTRKGLHTKSYFVSTPLDGVMQVFVRARTRAYTVALRDEETGALLEAGRAVALTVCGGRELQVDVRRGRAGAGAFTLSVSEP